MKTMRIVLLVVLVIVVAAWAGPDKYDVSNFPLTAKVLAQSVPSGTKIIPKNPACENPKDDYTKGYCRTVNDGRDQVRVINQEVVTVTMEVADLVYQITGRELLAPGEYHVRTSKQWLEVLLTRANGKKAVARYKVVSVRAK
jgi:hypothetical protein